MYQWTKQIVTTTKNEANSHFTYVEAILNHLMMMLSHFHIENPIEFYNKCLDNISCNLETNLQINTLNPLHHIFKESDFTLAKVRLNNKLKIRKNQSVKRSSHMHCALGLNHEQKTSFEQKIQSDPGDSETKFTAITIANLVVLHNTKIEVSTVVAAVVN